jgi:hypothetical protein
MTEKCPKCNHPLQQAMFNVFDTDKALNGQQLVCTNPNCPIGRKNSPDKDEEIEL